MSFKFRLRYISLTALMLLLVFLYQQCKPLGQFSSVSDSSTWNPSWDGNLGGGDGSVVELPGSGGVDTSTLEANQAFFVREVATVFKTKCGSCHNEPRLVTGIAAPLTIYNYSLMRPKLASGAGSIGNDLIRKVIGSISHSGGNQCPAGATAADPVCGKLIQWWQKEFPLSASGKSGQVKYVSASGEVYGWALDPAAPQNKMRVLVYRDAPAGQGGVSMGEVMANQTGLGSYSGNYFSFMIPAANIDNRSHSLYVYIDTAVADNLVPGTPMQYSAFKMSAAGIAHYNANIAPIIQSTCLACHAFDINSGFTNLLSPQPGQGGSATGNNFYMNASGNQHPINGCAGTNLCEAIQQWWNIEFN